METTIDKTYAANLVTISGSLFNSSMDYFMGRWAHIPDDKFSWTPGGLSKTPIQIGAHIAVTNEFFARSFAGNPPVQGEISEVFAWMAAEEAKITTTEQATARLKSSQAEVNNAVPNLPAEAVAASPEVQFYLGLISRHPMMHGSQLDAYQLIWGDGDFHIEM
jgi:hypothetical protein